MSEITVQLVTKRLLDELGEFLKDFGFKTNKSRKCFSRTKNRFTNSICLVMYKGKSEILVDPVVSINSLDIEEAFLKACPNDLTYVYTLGNGLGSIMQSYDHGLKNQLGEQWKWPVRDEDSLSLLVKAFKQYFVEYAFRYFDENSSIVKVDELLNENPHEISIHYWLYPMRASIGLIAAKLAGRADSEQLVTKYSNEMERAEDPYKSNFEKVKRALKG